MSEIRSLYRLGSLELGEVNRLLARLGDRLDQLEGYRGTADFLRAPTSRETADADTEVVVRSQFAGEDRLADVTQAEIDDVLVTDGGLESSNFAEPTGVAPGTGWKLTKEDGFQAYGSNHVFGGALFVTDGETLFSVGKPLDDTSQQYPSQEHLGTATGCVYVYGWVAPNWVLNATIGSNGRFSYTVDATGSDTATLHGKQTGDNTTPEKSGVWGEHTGTLGYGVRGTSDTGTAVYGAGGSGAGVHGTTDTGPVDVRGDLTCFTADGGLAVWLTNGTGAATVRGTVVVASSTDDGAFEVAAGDADMPIGVVLESGVANGSGAWVVVAGTAYVLLKDATASTRGYFVHVSDTAGRADATNASPVLAIHWRELGHCLESKTAGTDVLAKCILHFN